MKKFLAAFFIFIPLLASSEERDVRMTEFQGAVWIKHAGEETWNELPADAGSVPLEEGETVKTGKGAEAVLQMDQVNSIELGENTEFELTSTRLGWTKLKLRLGKLLAKIEEKLEKNNRQMTVSAYTAVLAVRGTEFALEAPLEKTEGEAPPAGLAVFEGSVDASFPDSSDAPAVRVQADEEIDWAPGRAALHARALKRFAAHKKRMTLMRKRHARLRAGWRKIPLERRRAIRSKIQKRTQQRREQMKKRQGNRQEKRREIQNKRQDRREEKRQRGGRRP